MSRHRYRARREERNAIAFLASVTCLGAGAGSRAFAMAFHLNFPGDMITIDRVGS